MHTDFNKLHEPGWLKMVEQADSGFATLTVLTTHGESVRYSVRTEPLDIWSSRDSLATPKGAQLQLGPALNRPLSR